MALSLNRLSLGLERGLAVWRPGLIVKPRRLFVVKHDFPPLGLFPDGGFPWTGAHQAPGILDAAELLFQGRRERRHDNRGACRDGYQGAEDAAHIPVRVTPLDFLE